jgi:bacterioferritin (cytochrome b1)
VVSPEDRASRRAVLAGAGAVLGGGAVLALSGCGNSTAVVRNLPRGAKHGDLALLNRALALERYTIAGYTAGIPLLGRQKAKLAQTLLNDELAHAGELLELIDAVRGKPIPRVDNYDLGRPQTEKEVLELLHRLEREQLTLYLDLIPRLTPGRVRAAVASIFGSDAQHMALLRLQLKLPPAPSPFVTGSE